MRLRLSNPTLLPELIEFLHSRADMVTKRVAENEIEAFVARVLRAGW